MIVFLRLLDSRTSRRISWKTKDPQAITIITIITLIPKILRTTRIIKIIKIIRITRTTIRVIIRIIVTNLRILQNRSDSPHSVRNTEFPNKSTRKNISWNNNTRNSKTSMRKSMNRSWSRNSWSRKSNKPITLS